MSATIAPPPGRRIAKAQKRRSLKELRAAMGMTQSEMARLLDSSVRTIATMEATGESRGKLDRQIAEFDRLQRALVDLSDFSPEDMRSWFMATNEALGDSTPMQVIERGELDRVWRLIYRLEEGLPY